MDIIELFAGSRSLGKEADKMGHNVFSVDKENFKDIDLAIDIGKMNISDVPFIPNMGWASPDCSTYSIAACSTHRRQIEGTRHKEAVSDYAKKCDEVNQHFIELFKQWLKINPDFIFFIENPRGNLRHMDWMQEFNRHTVWYCQYGDDRAKPTDIWTNSKTWTPRPECRNYKYDKQGNIIDRHCHHESARRGAKTGTQGRKGSYERSKIPKELCIEILLSVPSKGVFANVGVWFDF
jgi:site-specific DNA-cytosine methylase